jgi:hypothetical protein
MRPCLSHIHPKIREGKNTAAAQSGGWAIRCAAAKQSDAARLARLNGPQLRKNAARPLSHSCSSPRNTTSSTRARSPSLHRVTEIPGAGKSHAEGARARAA